MEDLGTRCRHRGGTAGLSFRGGGYPARRAHLHSRNRWRILAKCYGGRTLLVALPGLLVYELVWLLFVVAKGHLGPHLRGKREFLGQLPDVLRGRRALQARRQVPDRRLLVGGPLTFSPALVARAPARTAAHVLDLVLAGWWRLVGWLAG